VHFTVSPTAHAAPGSRTSDTVLQTRPMDLAFLLHVKSRGAPCHRCMAFTTSANESTATPTHGGTAQRSLTSSPCRCATCRLPHADLCWNNARWHAAWTCGQFCCTTFCRAALTRAACCAGTSGRASIVCTRRAVARPADSRPGDCTVLLPAMFEGYRRHIKFHRRRDRTGPMLAHIMHADGASRCADTHDRAGVRDPA